MPHLFYAYHVKKYTYNVAIISKHTNKSKQGYNKYSNATSILCIARKKIT